MGSLTDLPPELVLGWAFWMVGGLVLMLWFRRRSAAAPRHAPTPRPVPSPASSVRRSGVRPVAARPASPPADDPFSELHTLLDEPDQR
ncbi:MAG: hypothetical protein IT180_13965 [Acidobacteria bacterium]|nr:hypothetical protein [Acidobacteriota bacterium]